MKKGYTFRQLFTYSGVNKARIVTQMIKYLISRLIGRRHVYARVNNYAMKLDLQTLGLSKVLYIYGSRELPDVYVANQIIQEGMVVADIGANIGYYALLEAKAVGPSGHVYAFEPDPRNIPLLKENVKLNQFEDRVTVYEQAVSNMKERKSFQLGERTNVSSFVDRPDVVGAVDVDCIALHEFEHMDKVDMLRMDAEGYECKIIEGVLPFLEKNRKPFRIMLEVHPQEYNDTDLNFIKNAQGLFAVGFSVTHLIANAAARPDYAALGYEIAGTWQETKHERDLYHNVKDQDTLDMVAKKKVRAVVFSRS